LTCRGIGVALTEHLNGQRGYEIRTSGRLTGTGFKCNGLGLRLGQRLSQHQPPKTNELFGSKFNKQSAAAEATVGRVVRRRNIKGNI